MFWNRIFVPYVRFHIFSEIRVTEWPPFGEKLLTRLTICFLGIFPPLGFWSGKFFLVTSFPDHCILLPFYRRLFCSDSQHLVSCSVLVVNL